MHPFSASALKHLPKDLLEELSDDLEDETLVKQPLMMRVRSRLLRLGFQESDKLWVLTK